MQLEKYDQIESSIGQADFVLIGLGEEWVLTDNDIIDDLDKKDIVLKQTMQYAIQNAKHTALKELCVAYYYEKYIPKKLENAYRNLYEMINGKNYYIVSLTIDSYLIKVGFDKDRIVNPCGTYKLMQCPDACGEVLISSEQIMKAFEDVLDKNRQGESVDHRIHEIVTESIHIIERFQCENCHKHMVYNQLGCGKYLEAGYVDSWQRYMKWLQGTLNKKLCVVEAGVGMKLPTVIRWPFEKTVFYNQKSNMIRIHEKYYQINQEVAERAFGCECNAVQLFCKENLEAF